MLKYKVVKNGYAVEKEPTLVWIDTEMLTPQAKLAQEMVVRWGMVASVDNGEDSAGRHQYHLMPVEAVVSRAIAMTKELYKALHENNMIIEVPDFDEVAEKASELSERTKTEHLLDKVTAKYDIEE